MSACLFFGFAVVAVLLSPLFAALEALGEAWREWKESRKQPHDSRCWCNRCKAQRRRFMQRWIEEDSQS